MKKDLTIAVVGAGIVGLCNALQLQQLGYQVTLFDPKGIGTQCSKGNAGHFATEQVFPLADRALLKKLPSMLFDKLSPLRIDWRYLLQALPWFARFCANMPTPRYTRHTKALKALNQAALEAYKRLLGDNFNAHIICKGSLLTFENYDLGAIKKIHQAYLANGVKVELLDKPAIAALEPQISDTVRYALLFTEVGHSPDPLKLSMHIYKEFIRLGGQFVQQSVAEVAQHEHNSSVIDSLGKSKHFSKVIICAGAWSKQLCQQLGYKLPIEAERGYHNMLSNHALSRPVASADRQFIMTPMQAGLRLAGTVEFAGLHRPPFYARAASLLTHAQALLKKFNHVEQGEHWMGPRPSLPDSLPVIGQAPTHPNILFALGHQHLGLTQAAITSELIANLVANKPTVFDITPYSIARFQ
ncbi:NAD(P)/FAD-dependent oxidoreductase [Pseudoalteromonas umbrosa]|uniref:NAD(P)/FAD-dependent oxidoreductase n=1 Tax=Pseudoalteromonas umbrosa TaxID=3048489 RepID=UPI0024C3D0A7|nr:FAD-dependent oxidoreductase [Pseudoalteromonas sp. B95]MDK1285880.1 FAD-dependent oxidoreductase [Pseudoalteromonas sp. B95]